MDFLDRLVAELAPLRFAPPVHTVYNPLEYAGAAHRQYWARYGQGPKRLLWMGMNPGPWGMAQTGVPFGEVSYARDYLGIDAPIGKPPVEHPKRPITGWETTRSEVSGQRVWGYIQRRFPHPEDFFRDQFIYNYCPLVFMEDTGRNRTPDKLPKAEREAVYGACRRALQAALGVLQPHTLIAVGKFAEERGREAAPDLPIVTIPHPSPANPAANSGWEEEVDSRLKKVKDP